MPFHVRDLEYRRAECRKDALADAVGRLTRAIDHVLLRATDSRAGVSLRPWANSSSFTVEELVRGVAAVYEPLGWSVRSCVQQASIFVGPLSQLILIVEAIDSDPS